MQTERFCGIVSLSYEHGRSAVQETIEKYGSRILFPYDASLRAKRLTYGYFREVEIANKIEL